MSGEEKMKKQPVLYVLLGVLIAVFCGALLMTLRSTGESAGHLLVGLQEAASNAYHQQSQQPQQNIQQTQPSQYFYQQPSQGQDVVPQPTQPSAQEAVNMSLVLPQTASKEEVLYAMSAAVNAVKTARNFGAVKYQNIDIKLDECSVPLAVTLVNPIINGFTGEETLNYQFVDGTCIGPKSGEPVTPNLVIPPSDVLFGIDPNGVLAYEVKKEGTDTKYSVGLIAETATLEAPAPYYHSMCMDYLNIAALDLGSVAKLHKADFSYPGATVNVTVNAYGQIIRYEEYMPVSAYGEGSIGLSASGTISGFLHEIWTFTW